MATLPTTPLAILEHFGPHRAYALDAKANGAEAERLVKTHCCFCGQQCGIQLKTRGNQVVGFEPWEEFPFNRGMLCPKGVKRYLQGSHPDRLLHARQRDPSAPGGFRALPYSQAIEQVADAIQRIQAAHGNDAFAVLSGASLTNEKAYLMGKFARMCLKTANIDYNGRLCMVSAAAGNKNAFGIDRAANPWSDIVSAEVVWISGANIGECAPITTHYVWQARENGARIIVVDPRITPIARTCDLFLPIKPGRDIALFNGILHLMIENDWLDHDFIAEHTVGFEKVAEHVHDWTPRRTAEVTGIAERLIRQAAEWWGTARTSFLLHARHRASHARRAERARARSTWSLLRAVSAGRAAATPPSPARATARADASTAKNAINCPVAATSPNPNTAPHVAEVWGIEPDELPGPGVDAYEIFRKIDRGEVRGLLSICFNPKVSLPDNTFVGRMLDKLEFFVAIDFFLSETAHHAEIVLPGSLHEEDEGTVTQIEGRVIKINQCVDPPGDARRTGASCRTSRRRWAATRDSPSPVRVKSSTNCGAPRRAASPITPASPTNASSRNSASSGRVPRRTIPEHRDCSRRTRGIRSPEGRAAFTSPTARPAFTSPPTRRRPRTSTRTYPIILTTGRVVSQFLSGTQTRRIGPLVDQYPEPRIEMHPRLASRLGISDGDWATVASRRGSCTLRVQVVTTIRPDTVFVPYHWAGRAQHQSGDDRGAGSDFQDPGVQSVRRARAQGRRAAGVCREL